ncbi:MAG TPA: transcriptional regulator MraZ [Candidatus Portnoybacteria bacterium]|nr:transcriptional regulator MraZ [Candidatus Portnoybacteria bacterium]
MFIGEYRHTLDEKRRLAVPAKFRRELGKGAVITRGTDNCLVIYPEKVWQKVAEKLSQLPASKMEARKFARVVLAGASAVDFDKLGRILVPDYLCQYAGLKKNTVIAGLYDKLEVWDENNWNKYRGAAEKEVNQLIENLGETGI